jgi:hypothetical protein
VGRRGNSKGAAALDPLTRFGGTPLVTSQATQGASAAVAGLSSSGSLAMLAAMRRASSRVRR